ncbi:DarT ssDNA thymidine ADP-ribosyltransferase family protein [Alteromonas australica]|uniref:DarT ssDNA thymidine ADP-ribosyltransferase family protein n=1 Tax=Alteromonas australica TaxID=589873 RepID=UPI0035C7FF75
MKRAVEARGIRQLVHFTRYENLQSILGSGLKPRSILEEEQFGTVYNDVFRADGRRWANCLSIDHPNYKMFYSLRNSVVNQNWVVIVFKPSILWELPCLFTKENAATNLMASMSNEDLSGVRAFESMFLEAEGKASREAVGLNSYEPTNPQAEVLVGTTITPNYIVGVATVSAAQAVSISRAFPELFVRAFPAFFSARRDYGNWNG